MRVFRTEEGLGVPAILFLAIGGAVLFLVILACIYLTWRHSRTRSRELSTFKQGKDTWNLVMEEIILTMILTESNKVGRAIQRASFFPRFSQYWNQPVVVPYPDPDSHLPNYPIRTPYTFSSSSTLASTPGSIRLLETPDSSSILSKSL